jgi:transposase InsO family protein
MHLPAQAL